MPTARVEFQQLIQDTQSVGSSDFSTDHLISRVCFALFVDGIKMGDMFTEVTQPYGTDYASEPLEVGAPLTSAGPYNATWNATKFGEYVEQYYRGCIGQAGRGFRFAAGSNVRMRNNRVVIPYVVEFEVPQPRTSR